MDHVFTIECERHVPNRFALVHVAAARTRALNRGAEPRLPTNSSTNLHLALREIAAGAITPDEIEQLLHPRPAIEPPAERMRLDEQELLAGMGTKPAGEVPSYAGKALYAETAT